MDAKADLSLCWVHMPFCWFVMRWLIQLNQSRQNSLMSGKLSTPEQKIVNKVSLFFNRLIKPCAIHKYSYILKIVSLVKNGRTAIKIEPQHEISNNLAFRPL